MLAPLLPPGAPRRSGFFPRHGLDDVQQDGAVVIGFYLSGVFNRDEEGSSNVLLITVQVISCCLAIRLFTFA